VFSFNKAYDWFLTHALTLSSVFFDKLYLPVEFLRNFRFQEQFSLQGNLEISFGFSS
jgi:hypothetical protein